MTDEADHVDAVNAMICRIEDIGRIEVILRNVLDNDVFDDLSKHNKYFHSDGMEDENKLYDLRCKLVGIQDGILEGLAVINKDYSA